MLFEMVGKSHRQQIFSSILLWSFLRIEAANSPWHSMWACEHVSSRLLFAEGHGGLHHTNLDRARFAGFRSFDLFGSSCSSNLIHSSSESALSVSFQNLVFHSSYFSGTHSLTTVDFHPFTHPITLSSIPRDYTFASWFDLSPSQIYLLHLLPLQERSAQRALPSFPPNPWDLHPTSSVQRGNSSISLLLPSFVFPISTCPFLVGISSSYLLCFYSSVYQLFVLASSFPAHFVLWTPSCERVPYIRLPTAVGHFQAHCRWNFDHFLFESRIPLTLNFQKSTFQFEAFANFIVLSCQWPSTVDPWSIVTAMRDSCCCLHSVLVVFPDRVLAFIAQFLCRHFLPLWFPGFWAFLSFPIWETTIPSFEAGLRLMAEISSSCMICICALLVSSLGYAMMFVDQMESMDFCFLHGLITSWSSCFPPKLHPPILKCLPFPISPFLLFPVLR